MKCLDSQRELQAKKGVKELSVQKISSILEEMLKKRLSSKQKSWKKMKNSKTENVLFIQLFVNRKK
jgi:hypothetical protein